MVTNTNQARTRVSGANPKRTGYGCRNVSPISNLIAMEQNNPQPDCERITVANGILSTEIPRIRNIEPAQQYQEIIGLLQGVERTIQDNQQTLQDNQQTLQDNQRTLQDNQRTLQDIQQAQQAFNRRLIAIENTTIQFKNKLNQQSDPNSVLFPLRDLATGNTIPHCPNTSADIHRLSALEATRILRALQVPVPAGRITTKRTAVLREFL
ncbi:hypothetical protein HD806DRAFT_553334 [Xylariaceae sp. AK1471]|nr:hypothetical protein HD806DRAFT_553334 [Xylariaceae sp. AK1471]